MRRRLTDPTFVIDYPASILPTDQAQDNDPNVAERFELFVHGMELANAYTELTILSARRTVPHAVGRPGGRRFNGQDGSRFRTGPAQRHATSRGLGIGIDRLIMLLTNSRSIRDIVLFPLLRHQD